MWAKPAARGRCAWRRRDAATGRQCSRCCHQSNSSSSTLFSHCALATADRNQADEFADVPSGAAADPSAVSHPGSWTEPPCPHFLGTATRPECALSFVSTNLNLLLPLYFLNGRFGNSIQRPSRAVHGRQRGRNLPQGGDVPGAEKDAATGRTYSNE